MKFDAEMVVGGDDRKVNWWILDIPLPGPFGYGTYDGNKPFAFWFPVISGWVQQEFFDYKEEKPDSKFFKLPEICSEETTC